MNPVKILRDEHKAIEMELSELDFIMKEVPKGVPSAQMASTEVDEVGNINYSNLVHTFWKVGELWTAHEKMEEELFEVMKAEGFAIPIETIFLEHRDLRGHVKKIGDAINSGSDARVREALVKDMRVFVDVLRKHAEDEDEVLFGVVVSEFSAEGMKAIKRIVLRAGK
ncbi:hypothetical protein HN903_01835 [archaeon]|jgi:hemerythrin-like domain-containing protein|nr:hypothetical protein [archaeon]MBT7128474.1 hypothetical protein [archaeon]